MPPYRGLGSPPWGLRYGAPAAGGPPPLFTITLGLPPPALNIGYVFGTGGAINPEPVDINGRMFGVASSQMAIFSANLFTFRFDAASIVAWRTANLALTFRVGSAIGDVLFPIATSALAIGNTAIRWTAAGVPEIATMWPVDGPTYDVFLE